MLRALSAGAGAQPLTTAIILWQVLRNPAIASSQPRPTCRAFSRHLLFSNAATPSDGEGTEGSPPEDHAALSSIRSALQDGKRGVICQGSVQLGSPVSVFGQDDAGQHFAVQLPPANDAALQPLLDACVPAVFGRGSVEVLDESYRRALALPADRFGITFDLSAHPILWDVRSLLMPDAQSIRARLHKLNIYGPGGFFKQHKDTPRTKHQFASLVICLPVPHEAGNLLVRHAGDEKARTSWGSDADSADCTVRWMAFYSDCDHEVKPVTKGHHITLTYELTVDSATQRDTPAMDPGTVNGTSMYAALQAALEDPTFLPSGGTLGIACSHKYYRSIRGNRLTQDMLKGEDALAFAVAEELQLDPCLMYLFAEEDYNDMSDWDAEEAFPGARPRKWYQLLGSYKTIMLLDWDSQEGSERDILEHMGAETAEGVVWLNEADLNFDNEHMIVTYGNEAGANEVYSAAAILLEVPPMGSNGHRADESE